MKITVNRDARSVQKTIANESTKKIIMRNLLTVVLFVTAISIINAIFDDGFNASGILFGVPVLFAALLTTDLLMRRHYRRKLARND